MMGGQTIKQKLKAAGSNAAQLNNVYHFLPSEIRVDMRDNVRKAFYTVADVMPEIADWSEVGDAMCFSRSEIEKRLASFLKTSPRGQSQECIVYLTADGHPVLSDGYLRWSAMALAEATGVMGNIAGAKTGLRCLVVPRPTKPDDQISYEFGRLTSNEETLPMTAIDLGYAYARIMKANGITAKDVAERRGIEVNAVNTCIRLTTAKLRVQIEVREGRLTKTAALAMLSKTGEGGATGSTGAQKGVKKSALLKFARAVKDQEHAKELFSSGTLTMPEVYDLIAYFAGCDDEGKLPKSVKAIIKAIDDAPAKPKAQRGRPKKMAKKPGES